MTRLVDIKYSFECDWLIELSDDKLSDNNLAGEVVKNMSVFLKQWQSKLSFFSTVSRENEEENQGVILHASHDYLYGRLVLWKRKLKHTISKLMQLTELLRRNPLDGCLHSNDGVEKDGIAE